MLAVGTLAELGVARVSLGSSIAEAAYAVVRRSARELLTARTYTALAGAVDYTELNGLLRGRPGRSSTLAEPR